MLFSLAKNVASSLRDVKKDNLNNLELKKPLNLGDFICNCQTKMKKEREKQYISSEESSGMDNDQPGTSGAHHQLEQYEEED